MKNNNKEIKTTITEGFKKFYERETGNSFNNAHLEKGKTLIIGGIKVKFE